MIYSRASTRVQVLVRLCVGLDLFIESTIVCIIITNKEPVFRLFLMFCIVLVQPVLLLFEIWVSPMRVVVDHVVTQN